jgi:quinolinate synthase
MKENRLRLGGKVVILGHHYQREDVISFADFRGDSFKLSQFAANQTDAAYTIFCGVHFMAETASILGQSHQKVLIPNINAGCSMADMAPMEDVEDCWNDLTELVGLENLVPVTYMNSIAGIKALCGRNNGIVCTSSNAKSALEWAYQKGKQVVFFPDQHLGRNTGLTLGIPPDEMVLWNPFKPLGGNSLEELKQARLILWKGHCSVHTRFTVGQIEEARRQYPTIQILVHPECIMEVVQQADSVGSTEHIARTISEAPSGSVWGVGTEINLVTRLAHENPDKTVFCLDPIVCPCSTMYRIHPAYLLWLTDELIAGRVQNQVSVPPEIAHDARKALNRMLQLA